VPYHGRGTALTLFVKDWLQVLREFDGRVRGSESDRWTGVSMRRIAVQAGVVALPFPRVSWRILRFLRAYSILLMCLRRSAADEESLPQYTHVFIH
jgi:hypothetical protein